jgi:hypothetical protein
MSKGDKPIRIKLSYKEHSHMNIKIVEKLIRQLFVTHFK